MTLLQKILSAAVLAEQDILMFTSNPALELVLVGLIATENTLLGLTGGTVTTPVTTAAPVTTTVTTPVSTTSVAA